MFIFELPYLIPWWLSGWWGVPIIIYTGKRCPKGYLVSIQDRLFHVIFDTQTLKQHADAKATNGKNAFKLEKMQSLKVRFVEN